MESKMKRRAGWRGAGRTWVGVAPDGTVGINEGGRWSPQGHYDELRPGAR